MSNLCILIRHQKMFFFGNIFYQFCQNFELSEKLNRCYRTNDKQEQKSWKLGLCAYVSVPYLYLFLDVLHHNPGRSNLLPEPLKIEPKNVEGFWSENIIIFKCGFCLVHQSLLWKLHPAVWYLPRWFQLMTKLAWVWL
jgi:hypothetical protein